MTIKPYRRAVHFYETDAAGIVHHSNPIRWFEEARVDFLEQIGYGYRKVFESGFDFVLLSVVCDYRSMVRFGETVLVETNVTGLTPLRLTVGYTVTDGETGVIRAAGHTKHCCFDRAAGSPVALKKALPELTALFEKTINKE
ncbi:MAG: acyl-CoA thioesterase [Oscillospiraceae bacterium]|nr:acyl-CoA thioesterase [Oscillospiraceae bacterium]